MKLVAFTIVLDGEPFIERHLPVFQQLTIRWHWIVVEGAAGNTADTSWCKPQEPRLSRDGTREYLESIANCKNVTYRAAPWWKNKTDMCNVALTQITEPCVLMQVDSDEIWTAAQLERIVQLFEEQPATAVAKFACRYFVGPNLLLEGEHCYGDFDHEWTRAWRFHPGDVFVRHEPPILRQRDDILSKEQTRKLGLVFDHYAWATEAQAKYKESFYGYENAAQCWRVLQQHNSFPVSLSRFFPWVQGQYPMVIRAQ